MIYLQPLFNCNDGEPPVSAYIVYMYIRICVCFVAHLPLVTSGPLAPSRLSVPMGLSACLHLGHFCLSSTLRPRPSLLLSPNPLSNLPYSFFLSLISRPARHSLPSMRWAINCTHSRITSVSFSLFLSLFLSLVFYPHQMIPHDRPPVIPGAKVNRTD